MKVFFLSLLFLGSFFAAHTQSKVFNEVQEEMSSSMEVILQDNELVGYLLFTRLEKIAEDSFNYRLLLLDENLNEIGKVNFKDVSLDLEAAAFESDVLCLTYLKSNIQGKEFKHGREYKAFEPGNYIFSQFLRLPGTIIAMAEEKITLECDFPNPEKFTRNFFYTGHLRNAVQLKNIPGKGFACFYGDRFDRNILAYATTGQKLWKRNVSNGHAFNLLTSANGIYLLERIYGPNLNRLIYLSSINQEDGSEFYETSLADSTYSFLNVSGWGIDPVTGIPYLGGNITSQDGQHFGVFSVDLATEKSKLRKKFFYWNNGHKRNPFTKAYVYPTSIYLNVISSFRDFDGNTYFFGTRKNSRGELLLLLLTKEGVLTDVTGTDISSKDGEYYTITNPGEKENYIVVDRLKNVLIYSIKKKKIIREISKKEGKTQTTVFPAKEGHIIVVETNKKEKYTRLSIEPLH